MAVTREDKTGGVGMGVGVWVCGLCGVAWGVRPCVRASGALGVVAALLH